MAATSAPPVEVLINDAYRQILLRLPPTAPSCCIASPPTWRSLLTDPAFLRRYREFHGLPHLIGYVHDGADGRDLVVARFVTTADTTFRPRVPEKGVDLHVLDSRHGRVIFRRIGKGWLDESSLIIWDPVADHHQEVPLPEAFAQEEFNLTATVLCDALGCDHLDCHGGPFRVVFVGVRDEEGASATSAFNYTSSSGSWTASPAAAAAVADEDDWGFRMPAPSILVGGTTLYFRSPGRILRYWFGDEMEHLSYVDIPPFITQETRGTVLMPAADGRLSFAAMYGDMTISFWETEVSADGAVDWVHTQNALVSIPLPGVLIGAAASLLFIRTEDGGIVSVQFHGLPHLIGYVHDGADGRDLVVARFVTTADTTFRPRVPEKGVDLHVLDSRHGRVIFRRIGKGWLDESSLIIWDPVADHHQEVPLPEAFAQEEFNLTATVLCDALGCDHLDCHGGPFRVVFVGVRDEEGASATSAFNYTSSSGSWTASPAAAAAVADEDDWGFRMPAPSILVGGTTLYFRSPGRILRYWFGDEMEHLSYVDIPPFITQETRGTVLMPAADGRLSFAAMYGDMTISFWETEVSADGAVDWVHTQNALVSIPLPGVLIGAAASLLFIRTEDGGIVSVQVGNGRFQMLPQPAPQRQQISGLIPFMSFCTP
uniref:F-box domain-containing protein n=1 Tax=Oryza meridionalis TaxID=40149 RepID=A0A0E0EW05_9ORYZ